MSKILIPYAVSDVSALARSLSAQLAQSDGKPGHVALLNMLARAAGFRNFQHFRAASNAQQRLEQPAPVREPVDHALVERLTRHFDREGRLSHWPSKVSHQVACLWVLWSRLAPRESLRESEISALLKAHHSFGDHALLRRALVDYGLVTRTTDGREYRRVEQAPPTEALSLIRNLQLRQTA